MSLLRSIRSFPLSVRLLLVNQCGVNTGFYLLVPYLAMHLSGDLGLSAAVVGVVLGVRNLSYWHVEKKSLCVYSQLKSCRPPRLPR